MVAEVVERCYGGGGGGDQEQALLRRACVFLGSLAACCYQNRTLRSRKAIPGPLVGSQSRAFKYIVPLYLRKCCSTTPRIFDFILVPS